MNKKFYFLLLIFAALVLTGAGCISFNKAADDGGIFVSLDRGDSWVRKIAVLTVGEPKNIGRIDVSSLEVDPSDSSAIYATTGGGMYVTYDAGNSWQRIKALGKNNISSIAIDYKDKCNIYAAAGNKIYKSSDCGRTFGQPIYDDPRTDNRVTSLDVDSFNSQIIYAGTSKGDLLKSLDGGKSWKTVNRFNNGITKVLIDQGNDTRRVYVATERKGIFRTVDAGENWEDSGDSLKKYAGALEFRDMAYQKDALILATKYGLFRSGTGQDWGKWEPIDLLTAPGSAYIYSLAVNPKNAKEIYYGADTTFYRTTDGGKTWATKKLPTSRAATALLVHPQRTDVIYLGVTALEEDSGF